jgi:hypothetical protein
LTLVKEKDALVCLPLCHPSSKGAKLAITPGGDEKGKVAKFISRTLEVAVDEVLLALPSGGFEVEVRG